MTLIEKMMELDPEEIMFIGSRTNFIFVGNRDEFEEHIEQCLKQSAINVDAERLVQLKAELAEKKAKMEDSVRIRSLEKWITVWEKTINDSQDPKNMLPIRERQVLDVYRRTQDDGTVIIIDGVEMGRYWFYEDTEWCKNK